MRPREPDALGTTVADGLLVRRLLPVAMVLPFVIGWLWLKAQEAGWFSTHAGMSLFALANAALFAALAWATAALLDRAHLNRRQAEMTSMTLAAIVESSDDAIISKDPHGIVTSWNKGAERLFGSTARDMVGTSIMRLIPTSQQDEETLVLERIHRGERIESFETLRQTSDGRLIEVSMTISPIKDAIGKVVGVSNVARDITERKRTQEALRTSLERFEVFEQNSWDAIHLLSVEGVILYESPSVIRVLGYTPQELVGRNSFDLIHPDDLATVGDVFGPLVATPGVTLTAEVRVRHKDGSWLWMDCVATNLLEHPAVRAIAVNYRDITERKRSDQAVRESGDYFRFLNDLMEATRPLADPEQIMTVMARMLGEHLRASRCAYADVENDSDQFTILHDYTDGCASTVGRYQLSLFGARAVATLHAGQTLIIRNVETELRPEDGADMFNAIGIKAIITCPLVKDGRLRAMMAVHQAVPRDWQPGEITIVQDVVERCWATIERRTAEERLRHLNVDLEQRVIERTAQLEAANHELEAFSYSVSHDLRAPLRAVDGFARAALEDFGPLLPAEGQRQLQTIRNSAKRMGVLIDDLLTFARFNRQELKTRVIDTGRLVRSTLDELGRPWTDRQVEIRLGNLPTSSGDPALLKQVWLNLLSNALKYTRNRGAAVIEIGCTNTGGADTFFVRDNGTGFDMRYADKLFGVFQRLHLAEDFEGTGVGLAIVQRIVRRHGGRVWANSAVDDGATFSFTLDGEAAA